MCDNLTPFRLCLVSLLYQFYQNNRHTRTAELPNGKERKKLAALAKNAYGYLENNKMFCWQMFSFSRFSRWPLLQAQKKKLRWQSVRQQLITHLMATVTCIYRHEPINGSIVHSIARPALLFFWGATLSTLPLLIFGGVKAFQMVLCYLPTYRPNGQGHQNFLTIMYRWATFYLHKSKPIRRRVVKVTACTDNNTCKTEPVCLLNSINRWQLTVQHVTVCKTEFPRRRWSHLHYHSVGWC